jgi:putative oxidoreductase
MNSIPNSATSLPPANDALSRAIALLKAALSTEQSFAPSVARVALGLVILPHGLQKTIGAFGGHGFEGTMGYFTGSLGLPWLLAFCVVLAESLGALALVLGAGSRLAAGGIAAVMVGAAATHAEHGFFMNWMGNQAGEGFEYHLLALGLAAVVLVAGGGKASVDGWLSKR